MAPDLRLAAVLLGSFALWLPALTSFLTGGLDAGPLATRYAASLAGTWLAITVLSAIVRGYQAEPDDAVLAPVDEPARRADDQVPVSDASGG